MAARIASWLLRLFAGRPGRASDARLVRSIAEASSFSATQQQFQTIARLRALRTLWAHVAEHVARSEGADWHTDPTVAAARQHAVMGRRIITRDDPSVNILRGTIACFAAAAGGAEAITVLPYDTAAGLPDGHSRRVARNTQTLLAAESHVGVVTDPAGGAWFVESLTAHYVDLAWKYVQGLESGGGMATAEMRALLRKNVVAVDQMRLDRLATTSPLVASAASP